MKEMLRDIPFTENLEYSRPESQHLLSHFFKRDLATFLLELGNGLFT
jgi:hypothetical protein